MKKRKEHILQVIIASGPEALGRAVLGFAFALSAAISGVQVTVILTLSGIAWVQKDTPAAGQSINGFSSISDYMSMLEANGAVFRLCSSCVDNFCTKRDSEKKGMASYVGLTEVAIRASRDAVQTIIF